MWIPDLPLPGAILLLKAGWMVINKPAGMASIPDLTGDKSVLDLCEKYFQQQLYPVHRLDRPVSGCLVLARTKKDQTILSKPGAIQKKYYAIVNCSVLEKSGDLTHYIVRDGRAKKARCYEKAIKGSKKATLSYRSIKSLDNYDVIEIELSTGRFHQIRAQLAAVGAPVKGDVKYGARRSNKNRTIDLHAYQVYIGLSGDNVMAKREPMSSLWENMNEWKKNTI